MAPLALALLLAAPPELHAWSTTDTVLQATFVVVTLTDYLQTRTFLLHDNPEESWEENPLLGRHPSQAKLAVFMGGGILLHTAIAHALPKPWRNLWQCAWIGIEGAVVYRNHQAGVRIRW